LENQKRDTRHGANRDDPTVAKTARFVMGLKRPEWVEGCEIAEYFDMGY